jgi:hypothetical protein
MKQAKQMKEQPHEKLEKPTAKLTIENYANPNKSWALFLDEGALELAEDALGTMLSYIEMRNNPDTALSLSSVTKKRTKSKKAAS